MKTKVFDSADILKKKLGCYLTYLAIKNINKWEFLLKLYHYTTESLYENKEKNVI